MRGVADGGLLLLRILSGYVPRQRSLKHAFLDNVVWIWLVTPNLSAASAGLALRPFSRVTARGRADRPPRTRLHTLRFFPAWARAVWFKATRAIIDP